jgi:hypothetical protein
LVYAHLLSIRDIVDSPAAEIPDAALSSTIGGRRVKARDALRGRVRS